MFLDCYSNTSVLVTGHTGFKGTWLSLWLHSLGAHVIGYSMKPPTTPNLFEACGLEEHIQHFEGDIRDTMAISEVVAIHKPKFIFHLAALPLVRDSYSSPRETFDTNVMGTISVLDALRTNTNPCSVVVVSTDKCYANASWEYGYRETDTLGGHDPYSASKAAMELAVSSYRQSFFSPDVVGEHNVRVSSARAGNVIGGGDWSQDRIVPDAIRALAEERKLKVRSPRAVRPWQHVLEPLSGYLWLAASMSRDEGGRLASSWNFGPLPSETYTVAALVDRIIAAWGRGEWVEQSHDRLLHEAHLLKLSIDKANFHLGWRPVWDFETTVQRTVGWYQRWLKDPSDTKSIALACEDDIQSYVHAAKEQGLAWSS